MNWSSFDSLLLNGYGWIHMILVTLPSPSLSHVRFPQIGQNAFTHIMTWAYFEIPFRKGHMSMRERERGRQRVKEGSQKITNKCKYIRWWWRWWCWSSQVATNNVRACVFVYNVCALSFSECEPERSDRCGLFVVYVHRVAWHVCFSFLFCLLIFFFSFCSLSFVSSCVKTWWIIAGIIDHT